MATTVGDIQPWGAPITGDLNEVQQRIGVPMRDGVPSRNTTSARMLGWYQLYANLYKGGRYVLSPPSGTRHPVSGEGIGTYLTRHPRETADEFGARLRDSFYLPYPREIVTIYTSTLFRQDVVRDDVAARLPDGHMDDVDLMGHSAREFLRRSFTLSQVYGWVGILTDFPRQADIYPSAYHEQMASDRPYSRVLLPTQFWDWAIDDLSGEFTYLLIQTAPGRWRRWYPGYWQDINIEGKVLDQDSYSLDRIPVDLLICNSVDSDDPTAPFGFGALDDIALMALHLYQICSLVERHQRLSLFTFLHLEGAPPPGGAQDLSLGESHFLWHPGAVEWVDPPTDLPREVREHVLWLIREIRHTAGVSTRSEESTEAHSGAALQWEYSSRHNAVYERAQNLEDAEQRIWRTHGQWLQTEIPVGAIRYPREYAVSPVGTELDEIERRGRSLATWPDLAEAARPLVRQKLRRVAIRDVGHTTAIDNVLASLEPDGEDGGQDKAGFEMIGQITSLIDLAKAIGDGSVSKETAIEIAAASLPIDRTEAEQIFATAEVVQHDDIGGDPHAPVGQGLRPVDPG